MEPTISEVVMMLGRSLHLAPHGPELPLERPRITGDIFMLEQSDGSQTLYVWWGCWVKGASELRKTDKGTYI